MRYHENREQSAEILRQALPLMSKQTAGFHPVSYALWYEYLAGINSTLHSALDACLGEGKPLTDKDSARLFDTYIAARDADLADTVESSMQRVLQQVQGSTVILDTRAAAYSESLEHCAAHIGTTSDESALRNVVAGLLRETSCMRQSADDLRQQLDSSQQEMTSLRGQLEQAKGLALRDSLTGLHNRRAFEQTLKEAVASGSAFKVGCVLLLADIDHFKRINDTYGHVLGDKVIRAVAQAITLNTKGSDLAARYGGEEFAVFLPETSVHDGAMLADKIRAAVARCKIHYPSQAKVIDGVTISIGITQALPGESLEALVERADGALYKSKQNGRNQVTVASATRASLP